MNTNLYIRSGETFRMATGIEILESAAGIEARDFEAARNTACPPELAQNFLISQLQHCEMVNDMGHRGRVTVQLDAPSQHILVVMPKGYERLGLVSVGSGDPGVLAEIIATGDFVQLDARGTTSLDRRKVEAAIEAATVEPRSVGRPRKSFELREVYSVSLEPSLAEYIRGLGDGNLSAGVAMLAIAHQGRAGARIGVSDAVRVEISNGPRRVAGNGDIYFWTRIDDEAREFSVTDLAQQDHFGVQSRATGKERADAFSHHEEMVVAAIQDLAERDPERDVLDTSVFERLNTNRALPKVEFPTESEKFEIEGATFAAVYQRRRYVLTINRGALQDAFGPHSGVEGVRQVFVINRTTIHRAAAKLLTAHPGNLIIGPNDLKYGW